MRILVVENHGDIYGNLREYFSSKGHEVQSAYCGLVGLNLAASKPFDAILLDVLLPGIDGLKICHSLRHHSRSQVGIILLSTRGELADCLAGFDVGADDFIIQPCAMSEVLARVEAIVSRRTKRGNRVLKVDTLRFDLDTYEVSRDRIALRSNPTCLKVLELLMRRSPGVVPRRELEAAVWGRDAPAQGCLRTNIHLLRRVLEGDFEEPLLHTVHGFGYKLAKVS